ncbi:PREDICTED: uncharacterized protein LOC104825280 [Tarenaya hassleriana]|uniref:uncharacterized protein LOC104825280 n=1 Tax=Tarenaya hassleriana TaxID=28532 RepID=UPI00053C9571|nr:PREDICTED: uncharacterized protein LOC104825280 [Tarenaya hassleriana]
MRLTVDVYFGGCTDYDEDGDVGYIGGERAKVFIDNSPNLSWEMFEEIVQLREVYPPIYQVWYKLPQEPYKDRRLINHSSDRYEFRNMNKMAAEVGEMEVFIEHDEVENAENEEEVGEDSANSGDDDDVSNDNDGGRAVEDDAEDDAEDNIESGESDEDNDVEIPGTPLNTDEEWQSFERPVKSAKKKGDKRHLYLGKTFNSGEEFKKTLVDYVFDSQFNIKMTKSSSTRYSANCRHKKCIWRVYCVLDTSLNKWVIKTYYPTHNHQPNGHAPLVNMHHIAERFKEDMRRNPRLRGVDIRVGLLEKYGLIMSKSKCCKARRAAEKMVTEEQKVQFAKLWDYEAELRRSNPNIITEIGTKMEKDVEVFDRFYICFDVLRDSWKKCCRPVIGLDGCFLKWELKGELLAAIGRDANNSIFPIAWAVVRIENIENWCWFVKKLKSDLELGEGQDLTIISDKQKGLLNAVANEMPFAEHRMCTRHIYANWRKSYKDSGYKRIFWSIAAAYHEAHYDACLAEMKQVNELAHEVVLRAEPHQWARAFFKAHSQCDDVNNNLAESFNQTIREARLRPMIDMLEMIRKQIMHRIAKRSRYASRCVTEFSRHCIKKLEEARQKTRFCTSIPSARGQYEVEEFGMSYAVDLAGKCCACRQWDLRGIPCQHALCIINEKQEDIYCPFSLR